MLKLTLDMALLLVVDAFFWFSISQEQPEKT